MKKLSLVLIVIVGIFTSCNDVDGDNHFSDLTDATIVQFSRDTPNSEWTREDIGSKQILPYDCGKIYDEVYFNGRFNSYSKSSYKGYECLY